MAAPAMSATYRDGTVQTAPRIQTPMKLGSSSECMLRSEIEVFRIHLYAAERPDILLCEREAADHAGYAVGVVV